MRKLFILAAIAIPGAGLPLWADEVADSLHAFASAKPQASNAPELRMAWEKLVRQGPESLPLILDALDTADTTAANWLLTAFDRIAERAFKAGGKGISREALIAFARDTRHLGR